MTTSPLAPTFKLRWASSCTGREHQVVKFPLFVLWCISARRDQAESRFGSGATSVKLVYYYYSFYSAGRAYVPEQSLLFHHPAFSSSNDSKERKKKLQSIRNTPWLCHRNHQRTVALLDEEFGRRSHLKSSCWADVFVGVPCILRRIGQLPKKRE